MEEFERYFSDDERARILDIAIRLNFSSAREALLSGLPVSYRNALPMDDIPGVQLIMDFDALCECFFVMQRKKPIIPVAIWLRNAALLFKDYAESDELKTYAEAAHAFFALHGPSYYIEHRKRIEEKLKEVLRLYYMPFLANHAVAQNPDLKGLAAALEAALITQFAYNKKVSIRGLKRKSI